MGQLGSVHWKKFEEFIVGKGCVFAREKGDHRVYWKKGLKRPLVIPRDRSLPAFIILNNLRVLGVKKEEFTKWLGK